MASPAVSVIVPYFNSRWSVGRTLRSIRAQTLTDFEAIIVDDGSTDDLLSEAGPLLAADNRFRIVRQDNLGLGGARNRGLREARAPLVAPIDADDMWHPEYLAALSAALEASPGAPFAYAYSHRVDEDDRLLTPLRLRRPPRHDFRGLLSLNSVGSGSAAVFRRDLALAAGGYDETLRARAAQGAEDWKLIIRLAAQGTPVLVERELAVYRITDGSMSQANPARQLRAIDAVIEDLRQEFPQVPRRRFADARTMMIAWRLPVFLRTGELKEALKLAVSAYLANPLWFLDDNIRAVHAGRARMALAALFAPVRERPWIGDLRSDGSRPFAFLD